MSDRVLGIRSCTIMGMRSAMRGFASGRLGGGEIFGAGFHVNGPKIVALDCRKRGSPKKIGLCRLETVQAPRRAEARVWAQDQG